eukprot:TRINITY_DN4897_c0_g1_i1.p1 TRINITY_DN4897_c0_g1~~TRINITY_DN4897_c0_g1_i1.p1  ORF type:complete len:341 (-),score=48.44 TRINITY_DN4897_c0_g1_i1:97-1119(-)
MDLAAGDQVIFSLLKLCAAAAVKRFDASLAVIMLIACIVVYFSTRQSPLPPGEEAEENELQPRHAIYFIIFGSLFLVILFFFLRYIYFTLTILVTFTSISALSFLFSELLSMVITSEEWNADRFKIPEVGEFSRLNVVALILSILFVIAWFLTRLWVLNNIIGIGIVAMMIKVVRINSLKVAALLLSLAFFYDIFWVFGSTPIFGQSVMAYVATSVDLPIKLQLPHFVPNALSRCSLIGLGDLVLPGLFLAFTYQADLHIKTRRYFPLAMGGYVLGLALCILVLWQFELAQPALLYLVPCTLIPIMISAALNRNFRLLWDGIKPQAESEPINPQTELRNV